MKNLILIILLLIFSNPAFGGESKAYQQGVLIDFALAKDSQFVGYIGGIPQRSMKVYAASVQVGDLIYVGERKVGWARSGASPWIINDPVQVRFDKKDKMVLLKPDGKETDFKIIKKVRVKPQNDGIN